MSSPSVWQSLIAPVTQHKRQLIVTLLSGFIAQCAAFSAVVTAGWLVMQVLTGVEPGSLWPGIAVLAATILITALARWALAWLSHDLAFALIETLQLGIFDGLARATPANTGKQSLGDIAATATHDAELMERFYAHLLVDYLTAFLMPAIALLLLLLISPLLCLIFLPCVLAIVILPLLTSKAAKQQGKIVTERKSILNSQIVELAQGWREIQMSGAETNYRRQLNLASERLNQAQHRYGVRSGMEQALQDGLMALSLIIVLWASVWLSRSAAFSTALLPLIVSIAAAALIPLREVLQAGGQWGALKASAERIFALQHLPDAVDAGSTDSATKGYRIQLNEVSFCYPQSPLPVLNKLSLTIAPGERIAIAGASGSGKTTLAYLLLRFYSPQSGHICFGDTALNELSLTTLRQQISWASQESWLFNDTLENNIRLGCPGATLSQIKQAAKLAQADAFIRELPAGYQTRCSGGGENFSGGQRQRIALARALVSSAPVIILDETSAGLDGDNEQKIIESLMALPGQRTLIMIAHRLPMLTCADRVVLLENGQITESGHHATLVAQQGRYAALVAELDRKENV